METKTGEKHQAQRSVQFCVGIWAAFLIFFKCRDLDLFFAHCTPLHQLNIY